MSRELGADLAAEVSAPALQPILLAEFLFDGGAVRLWSGIGTISIGGVDYTGAGTLLNISSYDEGQTLEAKGLSVTLSGISSEIVAIALAENYQGRVCNLYLTAIPLNPDGAILLEDGTGLLLEDGTGLLLEALSTIPTPYKIFSGFMDTMDIELGGDTCSVTVSAENKMIILNRTKERRYTAEDQKSEYPDDTGFDFVTALQDSEILW